MHDEPLILAHAHSSLMWRKRKMKPEERKMPASLRVAKTILVSGLLSLLVACGFQLRGSYTLPYESLYIDLPTGSVLGAKLKQQIRANGSTRLALSKEETQAILIQTIENRERLILSLNTAGRVREVRLRYRYAFRVVDPQGREWVPNTGIELTRDLTYDDSAILAKDQEEQLLWRDMEDDLAQQLLRRLAAIKPKKTVEN